MSNPNDVVLQGAVMQANSNRQSMEAGRQQRAADEAAFHAHAQGNVGKTSAVLWSFLSRTSNVLLDEAARFITQGEDEWRIAVILSHAACDTQTEETLEQLVTVSRLDHLRDALIGPAAPMLSLHKERVQTLFEGLTGEAPWKKLDPSPKAEWWDAWDKSIKRRNDVAHRGLKVTRDEASASYEACRKLVDYLQHVVDRVRAVKNSGTAATTMPSYVVATGVGVLTPTGGDPKP